MELQYMTHRQSVWYHVQGQIFVTLSLIFNIIMLYPTFFFNGTLIIMYRVCILTKS